MSDRTIVMNYLLSEKFDNSAESMSEMTGYSVNQIYKWVSGEIVPNKSTLDFIIMSTYTPEFTVVKEFYEIDTSEPIKTQLNDMFKGHEDRAGVYAFYDAMANLLYVGKASNLLQETYSAIMREDLVSFPSGIKDKMQKRFELVKYVSAYDVATNDHWDYPKHVESLILRISKPRLNKQIGILEQAYPDILD
ncbi:TPA: hypothetical protein N2828_004453 [Vibrio parahaemolyticus]|uniref:hypothetical protein n=1 Tax=Vibrio parahaemolyticus TaxID=670 RepID=UPI0007A0B456|nr:hypothetical protein [Vibrio parahaemolyticus]EGR1145895.1 hypothetical protein [Vibrio parahaemolyticus]EGR2360740.1 hypothetical protein [Vibrio parahaemolyticus]EGR3426574.1 hypothetical protein [Vibrio parahaemolyticus]EIS4858239.1 hypothetical protein [Vibrio parahaemolyticus]ELB1650755.1 hypothetical protein [Vibrio parahaemolyticus]